jgi:hypothetical protein
MTQRRKVNSEKNEQQNANKVYNSLEHTTTLHQG